MKIIGRYYQDNDETWIVHSGSDKEFYITRNYAEITLVGDSTIYSDITLRPRFPVYVNDNLNIDSLMNELEINVILFQNEQAQKNKVKVMLLSENKYGGIGIKKITVNTCTDSNVIEPTEKKDLSIEFIGDSLTCAYGVEGKDEYEHFKTSTENFSKSYACIVSNILNTDYSAVSFSGYGIVSGYSEGEKNANDLVSLYYQKIGRHDNYPGEWNFNKYHNDIIIINLGGNDNNYYKVDPEKRGEEYVQEYVKLINLVRECNPNSLIICTMTNVTLKNIYNLVVKAVEICGDNNVVTFQVPEYEIDKYGSDYHPSENSQRIVGQMVAERINEIINKYFK